MDSDEKPRRRSSNPTPKKRTASQPDADEDEIPEKPRKKVKKKRQNNPPDNSRFILILALAGGGAVLAIVGIVVAIVVWSRTGTERSDKTTGNSNSGNSNVKTPIILSPEELQKKIISTWHNDSFGRILRSPDKLEAYMKELHKTKADVEDLHKEYGAQFLIFRPDGTCSSTEIRLQSAIKYRVTDGKTLMVTFHDPGLVREEAVSVQFEEDEMQVVVEGVSTYFARDPKAPAK